MEYPHGTINCYWHGCRCLKCRLAHSDYKRDHDPVVPVKVAQGLIQDLQGQGMSMAAIASAAGLCRHTLLKIVNAEQHGRRHVLADTVRALRAVTGAPFDGEVLIDAQRARDKVIKMKEAGFTYPQIAAAGQVKATPIGELMRARWYPGRRMTASTALGVERAYQRLMFKLEAVQRVCEACGEEREWRGDHRDCPSCRSSRLAG